MARDRLYLQPQMYGIALTLRIVIAPTVAEFQRSLKTHLQARSTQGTPRVAVLHLGGPITGRQPARILNVRVIFSNRNDTFPLRNKHLQ